MNKIKKISAVGIFAVTSSLYFGGCTTEVNGVDTNVSQRVVLSSLHYIKEANVTMDTNATGIYLVSGVYFFYDTNVSGMRLATGGRYVTDETNESNETVLPIQCPDFNLTVDAPMPTLKAPADTAETAFPYVNINPFTTLLIDSNLTKAELGVRFPVAASLSEDFNFDATAARKDFNTEDQNLSLELCEAINDLQRLRAQ